MGKNDIDHFFSEAAWGIGGFMIKVVDCLVDKDKSKGNQILLVR